MDDSIHSDLLNAHADALLQGETDYRERYQTLFPHQVEALDPLFALAESTYTLVRAPITMRAQFKATLKADLLAQAHQQRLLRRRGGWRWAALGASAVTVGVIAAAAWRGTHGAAR
ncbi:MAG: hypothetical protein H0V67_05740 [Geodermatophilaceae bacterium]|nr:hypothetical protein [Geodermatophilaceae bacterium]